MNLQERWGYTFTEGFWVQQEHGDSDVKETREERVSGALRERRSVVRKCHGVQVRKLPVGQSGGDRRC